MSSHFSNPEIALVSVILVGFVASILWVCYKYEIANRAENDPARNDTSSLERHHSQISGIHYPNAIYTVSTSQLPETDLPPSYDEAVTVVGNSKNDNQLKITDVILRVPDDCLAAIRNHPVQQEDQDTNSYC